MLGALALGVILAQILLLSVLAFAPVALVVAVFPGRGHDFFRGVDREARRVPRAEGRLQPDPRRDPRRLPSAGRRHLKPRVAHGLRAAGRVPVGRVPATQPLTADLLTATAGPQAARDGASRLQSLYYTTRLARMAGLHRHTPKVAATGGRHNDGAPPPPSPPTPNTPAPSPSPPVAVPVPAVALPAAEPAALPAARQLALPAGETPTQEDQAE